MSSIIPVPSTRVPASLARDRLVGQLNADQIALARLQTQISTGRRVLLPSDDAPAALRGIAIQQILERKQQVLVNISTNQSYLSATDLALSDISNLLANIRSTALGVSDSGATDTQRQAAAAEIDRAIQQLVDTGNQQFRGRYLFSGSVTTAKPFAFDAHTVQYLGNESRLQSYANNDLLFETNVDGNAVFGSLSAEVKGTVDLNPVLSSQTLLSDLRGGQGIAKGSIAISDGVNSKVIDLSRASNLNDVKSIIEANSPPGRTVSVDITDQGLRISLDANGGGDLRIHEVGGGTMASDLGILRESGTGPGPFLGADLNPKLTKTTRLDSILGTRATATVSSHGTKNDIVFTAKHNGAEFNNVTIEFVDDPLVIGGHETATYDNSNPANPKIVFSIDTGSTTANDIIQALHNNPALAAMFSANLVTHDAVGEKNDGKGLIDPTATATTSDGSGVVFDATSGIKVVSGAKTFDISFASAVTIEDLLNKINGAGAGLVAEINATATGINIRSRTSGVDFSIGENGGTTATELGLRTFTGATQLEQLNQGFGIHEFDGDDFLIRRKDGVQFGIDVSGAKTIQDILDRINNHADNQDPAHRVTAGLAQVGNGIELTTEDISTITTLAVIKSPLSQAAIDLGLVSPGQTTSAPPIANGGVETLTGTDTNPTEVDGAFTALIRLSAALRANDPLQIGRAIEMLDAANLQLNNTRAEIGARQQSLDTLTNAIENEQISLEAALSDEIDVDLAEAITDLSARQASYQATLQTTALVSRMSLLDYL